MRDRLPTYLLWIGACAVGEAVALVVGNAVTAAGVTLVETLGPYGMHGLILLSGAFEGLCVGSLQWFVLRRIAKVGWRGWAGATAGGFFIVWLAASLLFDGVPLESAVAYGAISGLMIGLCTGGLQSLCLPGPARMPWVVANTVGWTLGLTTAPFTLGALGDAFLTGPLSGALVGVVAGTCTIPALIHLAQRTDEVGR